MKRSLGSARRRGWFLRSPPQFGVEGRCSFRFTCWIQYRRSRYDWLAVRANSFCNRKRCDQRAGVRDSLSRAFLMRVCKQGALNRFLGCVNLINRVKCCPIASAV